MNTRRRIRNSEGLPIQNNQNSSAQNRRRQSDGDQNSANGSSVSSRTNAGSRRSFVELNASNSRHSLSSGRRDRRRINTGERVIGRNTRSGDYLSEDESEEADNEMRRGYQEQGENTTRDGGDTQHPEGMQLNIPNAFQQNHANNRDTHEGDDTRKRELNLIEIYSQGVIEPPEESTKITIMNCVRSTIIPNVKFLTSGKAFGSFEQPNFADSECWVNKLFSNIPTLAGVSDGTKAKTRMTYRTKIREQFSLHRSAKSLQIKRKFLEGK